MARKPTVAQPKNLNASTSYSRERYAHPFYLPSDPSARRPTSGGFTRMTQWSKEQLGPVPKVKGAGVINLVDIIGTDGVAEVEQLGEIRFHALGDSGVNHAEEAERVAEDMATDYKAGAGSMNPCFLFHLGDVIYGPGKQDHYGERFYRPYRHYPGKILAIPGNHDGETKSAADNPSLNAFLANFCAETAAVPHQAASSGIYRVDDATRRLLDARYTVSEDHRPLFELPREPGIPGRGWRDGYLSTRLARGHLEFDRDRQSQKSARHRHPSSVLQFRRPFRQFRNEPKHRFDLSESRPLSGRFPVRPRAQLSTLYAPYRRQADPLSGDRNRRYCSAESSRGKRPACRRRFWNHL
ncbi:metallophosphoesterase [Mesorhizobium sp. CU2]|nr:metallophosphoesterase [Mesorhizobium sp. CU3]TPO12770.1 metallophosphoesterase [Mesorhizobium sp. CU2]